MAPKKNSLIILLLNILTFLIVLTSLLLGIYIPDLNGFIFYIPFGCIFPVIVFTYSIYKIQDIFVNKKYDKFDLILTVALVLNIAFYITQMFLIY